MLIQAHSSARLCLACLKIVCARAHVSLLQYCTHPCSKALEISDCWPGTHLVVSCRRVPRKVLSISYSNLQPLDDMVDSGKVVAVISTLAAALFAIYTTQISSPSVTNALLVEDAETCEATSSSCANANADNSAEMADQNEASSIYELSYTSIDGTEESMEKYRGHVLIVVNVASKCGYTCVNYEQLTELYDKYSESEGLRIVAFPCNQFMGQEPLGDKEIKEFAATYNVQYDMSSKVDVNGEKTHPVWKFLKKQQGGFMGDFIKWNFTKFLVDKKGNVVKRYAPTTNPRELEKDLLVYFQEKE